MESAGLGGKIHDSQQNKTNSQQQDLTTEKQNENVFKTPEEYLKAITTTLDLQGDNKLHTIYKALSNKYMSVLIVKLERESLQREYGRAVALLSCYHNKEKFFEMPLDYLPQYVDIFDSIIAWTIGANEDFQQQFFAIDVGKKENNNRNIEETKGILKPIKFDFKFEKEKFGQLMGFKLGYFSNPEDGNVKAVFWSQKRIYRFPFNTDSSKMSENEKMFSKNSGKIKINEIEDDEIDTIFDFGVRDDHKDDYEIDTPELILLKDTKNNVHILKGARYGQVFSKWQEYPEDIQVDTSSCVPLLSIKNMVLISTHKIVGIINKKTVGKEEATYIQVFEIKPDPGEDSYPIMTREFEIINDKIEQATSDFRNNIILDRLNSKFYVRDFSVAFEQMQFMPIDNDVSNRADAITINTQIAMNIVANNVSSLDEVTTHGLVYNDFLCADNAFILLHGKSLTYFDLINNKNLIVHARLYNHQDLKEGSNYYNMDDETVAVWLMDKNTKRGQRWRIIVAFKSGDVKEIIISQNQGQVDIKLEDYLLTKERQPTKLSGRIVKVLSNKNELNVPIYFIIERQDKSHVLSTIEFWSSTYREYELSTILNTNQNNVTYIILNINDQELQWQELLCITTKADTTNDTLEQKLTHIKIRIGQYEIEKSKEIIVLNKEDLQNQMENVTKARDIFVNGQIIYFVYADKVELYNLKDNNIFSESTKASVQKFMSFGNRFYYWRQSIGGNSEKRYHNIIYFDGFESFKDFGQQSDNLEVQLFSGNYPHQTKLYYDCMNDSIACFTSFYEIKIFTLLHLPRIKVKIQGNKENDHHIIATKLIAPSALCVVQNNNTISLWNIQTAKYMGLTKQITKEEGEFSKFIFHQRISDTHTLLRSKESIFESVEEARGALHPTYDMTDPQDNSKEIIMYYYKVISINFQPIINEQNLNIEAITIETHKSFIGPHYIDSSRINFGLYASDDLELYVLFYKNSQEKMQLKYCRINEEQKFTDDHTGEVYYYLEFKWKADDDNARLSHHSPNFKMMIAKSSLKDFEILDTSVRIDPIQMLPENLNFHTIQTPNFITNDRILYLTDDKIIKCYNHKTKQEDFITSHCHFPGATEQINLATLLQVGNHVIGENCLTFEQQFSTIIENGKEVQKIDEYIAPNNFNCFFLDAAEKYKNQEDYNEIKIIQCLYKSKVELTKRSIYGYFFTKIENEPGKISTQLYVISTYTYYQWRVLNQLKSSVLSATNLKVETLKSLAYAQIPDGQTLLHFLYKNKNVLEYVMKELQVLDEYGCKFYIPLLRDKKNCTALEYALDAKQVDEDDTPKNKNTNQVMSVQIAGGNENKKVAYRKTAGMILKHVGTYPFDLFKIQIKELIAPIIELGITEFAEFMTNCSKTPSFLRGYDRAAVAIVEECGAQVFEYDEVWTSDIKDFQSKYIQNGAEEKLISIKILDVPYIHHYTSSQDNIIYKELSNTKDRTIFQNVAIKAMIEQKWKLLKWNIAIFLLLPYLAFLTVFTYFTVQEYYSGIVIRKIDQTYPNIHLLEGSLRIFIVLFAFYFCVIEIIQAYKEGLIKHLKDFWNYLDIIPPIVIFSCEIINFSDDDTHSTEVKLQNEQLMRNLYSITALAMWLRFLYFFRIFRSTGYYISMLVEVIKDMGQFFFIFAITVISFAHTFFIFFGGHMIPAMEDDQKSGQIDPVTGEFLKEKYFSGFFAAFTYSYRLALGDFDTDNLPDPIAWIFFIIATLFVQIVFLNLLISIVAETFGRVQQDKANMMYQDMVDLIVENQFLITESKQNTTNKGKYLMLTVPDDQDLEQEEIIQKNFTQLRQEVQVMQTTMNKNQVETDYTLERILKSIKKLQDTIKQL